MSVAVRYPSEFDTWLRADQVTYVRDKYRRSGLVTELLEQSGLDSTAWPIDSNYKLSKEMLAGIVLELADRAGEDLTTDRYPEDFREWGRKRQAEYLAPLYRREGLLRELLVRVDWVDDSEVETDTKLSKEVLAAVYLTLEGIGHD